MLAKEMQEYPPDIGSITDHQCGCISWTSGGSFIVLACSATCPRNLAMQKEFRSQGKPVDYRPAWSR